jgi:hypothetical protein
LQSPAELPPRYNDFKPSSFNPAGQSQESVDQNLDFTERPNQVQVGGGNRGSFLNHRTRIFAPDSTKKATLVKDYFVNNNGDVFITTKVPFVPKPTVSTNPPTTVARRNPFSPTTKPTNKPISFNLKSNKKPFVPKNPATPRNGFDLESLLEEPIKSASGSSHNDDVVEVVKSKTTTEAVGVEETTTGRSHEETTIEQLHEETTTDFDYDTTLDPSVDYEEQPVSHESIDINSQEEEASRVSQESSYVNSQEEPSKVPHESVDVNSQEEASKAASQEADDHNDSQEEFDDYVTSEEQQVDSREGPKRSSEENNDIRNEDYEESESQEEKVKTTNATSFEIVTTKPSAMVKDDNFHEFVDTTVIDNITEEPLTTVESSSEAVQEKKSKSESLEAVEEIKSKSEAVEEKKSKSEALLAEPELVVSVVTTKSVVNNTVIPSVTSPPTVTVGTIDDNTTDTWVVVASVQTSRSVSGARYLPSPNVEQDERMKLLNEEVEDVTETTTEEVATTTLPPTTTKLKTSTESLIDKLDRVQSDLSSSLLTGGFNNEGNNIAVITENMSDKMATTMLDLGITSPQPTPPPPSSTKSSLPLVQIRKFSPLARPSTTTRPKKTFDSFNQNRKTTTTVAPVNLDQPQGDEPPKDEGKNATTGRTSGVSNKTQIIVQDVSAFLPPGYKVSDKDKEDTSKLLAEILGKVKPSGESETKNKSSKSGGVREGDVSALLPPGYKERDSTTEKSENVAKGAKQDRTSDDNSKTDKISKVPKQDDISSFLPRGYKPQSDDASKTDKLLKEAKQDDISAFLPPGYKTFKTTSTTTTEKAKPVESLFAKAKPVDDISALLPPGYKPTAAPKTKGVDGLLAEAIPVDISAFLPPGYKARTTQKPLTTITEKLLPSLLPPGYKLRETPAGTKKLTTSTTTSTTSTTTSKPSSGGGFKVVFPSRPGGGTRKPIVRLTTARAASTEEPRATPPTIQKGWPSRFVVFVFIETCLNLIWSELRPSSPVGQHLRRHPSPSRSSWKRRGPRLPVPPHQLTPRPVPPRPPPRRPRPPHRNQQLREFAQENATWLVPSN